jgi:hypothetical protein
VLLVHDHQADVGERCHDGESGPDHDVDLAGTDPPPLVGPFAVAQARVQECDAGVKVGPEPIDQLERKRDLRNEDQGWPAGVEGRGNRLDVDRGLSRAGDAVEEERAGVATRDRRTDPGDGLGLRRQELARLGPATATADRPARQRASGSLADLCVDEPSPNQTGERRVTVAGRQLSGERLGRWARASIWRGPR